MMMKKHFHLKKYFNLFQKYGSDFYRIVCPYKSNTLLILILFISTICTYLTTLCINYEELKNSFGESSIIFIILIPISYMFIHYSLISHPPTELSVFQADTNISPYLSRPLIWFIQLIPLTLCIYLESKSVYIIIQEISFFYIIIIS